MRVSCFNHFLNTILKIPSLRYSQELLKFLSSESLIEAKKTAKEITKGIPTAKDYGSATKGISQTISEFVTAEGEATLSTGLEVATAAQKLAELLKKTLPLEKKASKLCQSIHQNMELVASNLDSLSTISMKLASIYEEAEDKSLAKIYGLMETTFHHISSIQFSQSALFFEQARV